MLYRVSKNVMHAVCASSIIGHRKYCVVCADLLMTHVFSADCNRSVDYDDN